MKTQKLRSLMGNQRKPPDARKRDLLSRTESMGTVSCAIFDSLCCDPAPGCGHFLAALRAEAESSLRSLGAGRGTGRWQLCGSAILVEQTDGAHQRRPKVARPRRTGI